MSEALITYYGEQVSVPKEVADFLEQDRKREQAEKKRDQRHLSDGGIGLSSSGFIPPRRMLETTVFRNLQLENLQAAISTLGDEDRQLIELRYDNEMSQEEIGKLFGVSKMAISKRLKKLHQKLRDSVL